MLIRSQDKLRTTDRLDLRTTKTYIHKGNHERYCSVDESTLDEYNVVYTISSNYASGLGDYSTEVKAIKVLDCITMAYEFIMTNQKSFVFVMPEDFNVFI